MCHRRGERSVAIQQVEGHQSLADVAQTRVIVLYSLFVLETCLCFSKIYLQCDDDEVLSLFTHHLLLS